MLSGEAPSRQLLWCRVAGCSLGLTGVGHLATELLVPKTPEQRTILDALHELRVVLPGTDRSVAELLLGFSLIMGVLLIGGGVLIATARPSRSSGIATVFMTLGVCLAAWRYLFLVPGLLTTIALAGAIMALWSSRIGRGTIVAPPATQLNEQDGPTRERAA